MVITYHGGDCFKITQGELTLALNPVSKTSADVTLFTTGRNETSEKSGFVVDGPGEYEIKDIFIKGFPDKTFVVTFEGIKICLLSKEPSQNEVEDIDIALVPVESYKTAVALEPSVMIPMGYDKTSLEQFLKEAGETKVEPIDKLVVKKKDLEGKEGEIVVLVDSK